MACGVWRVACDVWCFSPRLQNSRCPLSPNAHALCLQQQTSPQNGLFHLGAPSRHRSHQHVTMSFAIINKLGGQPRGFVNAAAALLPCNAIRGVFKLRRLCVGSFHSRHGRCSTRRPPVVAAGFSCRMRLSKLRFILIVRRAYRLS